MSDVCCAQLLNYLDRISILVLKIRNYYSRIWVEAVITYTDDFGFNLCYVGIPHIQKLNISIYTGH